MDLILAALALVALPFTAVALASAAHSLGVRHLRHRDPGTLPTAAGVWARDLVEDRFPQVDVSVGVTPDHLGGSDAYWPSLRSVGLSLSTWYDHHPLGWTIAAHELGHVLDAHRWPILSRLSEANRLLLQLSGQVLTAGVLIGVLYPTRLAAPVALAGLITGTLSMVLVLLEELHASRVGMRLLRRHSPLRPQHLGAARASMTTALAAYASGLAARVALVAWWPTLAEGLRTGPIHYAVNPTLLLWAVVLLSPLLLLRAAQVLTAVSRPQPLGSDLRLAWVTVQEASWATNTALILAVWVALASQTSVGLGLAPLVLLAAVAAVGPLGNLARVVALVPVALGMRAVASALGLLGRPSGIHLSPEPTPELDAEGLNAGWAARVQTGLGLAWIPLAVVLLVRVVLGW